MKRTVINLLDEAVNKYGNAPYVLDKEDKGYVPKSYIQVANESDYFAVSLIEKGILKDDKIAVLAEGRRDWVMTEFGILKAGAISVPLSIKLLPEEILFRLNHSDSKYILVSRNTIEKVVEIIDKVTISDFKIIYFEKDLSGVENLIAEKGIKDKILFLHEMLIEGEANHDSYKEQLDEVRNGIQEDDVVTICYTSGTTGNPKGIMLTHLNYYANSSDAMKYFNVPEYYRLMIILPLDHSFAHTVGIYASLVRGLAIYFVDARGGGMATLKNIPINLKEANPHFMLTVPALSGNFMNKMIDGIKAKGGVIEKIFKAGLKAGFEIYGDGFKKASFATKMKNIVPYTIADKLIFSKLRQVFGDSLKFCVGGGALLDIRQQRFFYSIGVPIYQGYGLTEATPIISANSPAVHKLGTSGMVLPTIEAKIMKDDKEAPKGVKGELVIRGENVMKGYYKNEEASNEALRDGWLYTGDLGYFEEDGFLMITGREKALLISADGEKYSPEEIEEAIVNSSDLVFQSMIHNDHNKYTVGLATLNTSAVESLIRKKNITDAETLLTEIKQSFYNFKQQEDYKDKFPEKWIPSIFTIIPEAFTEKNFMINSTLKMVRFKIREVYNDDILKMYFNNATTEADFANIETLKKLFFNKG